jgi:hypothetical protein
MFLYFKEIINYNFCCLTSKLILVQDCFDIFLKNIINDKFKISNSIRKKNVKNDKYII